MLALLAGGALAAALAIGDAGTGTALSIARTVRLIGTAAVTGTLVLVLVVWLPLRRAGTVAGPTDDAFVVAARRALRGFALVGGLGAVAALALEAVDADRGLLDALTTRSGAWLVASALAFAGIAAVAPAALRAATRRGSRPVAAALALLAVVNVAPVLGGNAVSSSPALALVPIEIVHVVAMGAWVGGLLALLLVVPHAVRTRAAGVERSAVLAAVLLRFTPVALVAVAALTLAGTGLSLLSLTTLYDLADTAYGRALFAKIVLLLIVVAIAVLQREYLMPRLERAVAAGGPSGEDAGPSGDASAPSDPEEAARHVRTAMRGEALLLGVVLIVTGALAGYPPPKTLAGKPVVVARTIDGLDLQVVVAPARVGDNDLRLRVRGQDGRPAAVGAAARLRAVPPGRAGSSDQPVEVVPTSAGAGRWTARLPLGARGSWKLELTLTAANGPRIAATLPVRVR